MFVDDLVSRIKAHRCYSHPVFRHWAENAPPTEVIGALFHQIRNFCDSTRPALNLPLGLERLGLNTGSDLLQKIAQSEENHGPELAAMAGHIMNRSAGSTVCPDTSDQAAVENKLKECSDRLLGTLPGYATVTGLMPQTRRAMAVFQRRNNTDAESTYRNLGAALALEMISYRQLIPGEKLCLVDSGLYKATLQEPEMHYLLEHDGEGGAEAIHEHSAIQAIASVLNNSNQHLITEGVDEFLDSLTSLWDLLDTALLQSGYAAHTTAKSNRAEESERKAITNNLTELWEKILRKEVDVEDDFFESGGDSMAAIRMVMEVQSTYNLEIEVETFFMEPTISRLAGMIASGATATMPSR
jgi:acyl carrier protein